MIGLNPWPGFFLGCFFCWYHPLNEQFDPENLPWLEEGMVFQALGLP